MMPPVKELSTVNNRLAEAQPRENGCSRSSTPSRISDIPGAERLTGFERAIEFHGVGFRYAEGDRCCATAIS
jgi:hypothetical protein